MKPASVLTLALFVLAATPIGIPARPPISAVETQTLVNSRIVSAGLSYFSNVMLRYPDSYDELCNSGFIPVRCADVTNPYTNAVVRDAPNSEGDLHLERTPRGLRMTNYNRWKKPSGEPDNWSLDFGEGLEMRLKNLEDLRKIKGFKDPYLDAKESPLNDRAAMATGMYVKTVVVNYSADTGGHLPRDWNEVVSNLSKARASSDRVIANLSWEVEKIRNEFTGGYAHAVGSPSPGDFRYEYDASKNMAHLEAYGAGGKVVYEYTFVPPNPPTEEVLKVHPIVKLPLPQ